MTATLFVGNTEVSNVFELVGYDEDSISLAIAWALTNAPNLMRLFVKRLGFGGVGQVVEKG